MTAFKTVFFFIVLLSLGGAWATEIPAGNKPSTPDQPSKADGSQQISASASTVAANVANTYTHSRQPAKSAQQQQMETVMMASTSSGSFGPSGSNGKTITISTTVEGDQPPKTVTTTSTGPMQMPQLFGNNNNNMFYGPQPWLANRFIPQPWMANSFITQPGAAGAVAAAQMGSGRHLLGTDAATSIDSINATQSFWRWHPWSGSSAQASAQSGSWLTGSQASAQADSWNGVGGGSWAQADAVSTGFGGGSYARAEAAADSGGGVGGGVSFAKASAVSGGFGGGSSAFAQAESSTWGKKLLAVPAGVRGNRKMLRGHNA